MMRKSKMPPCAMVAPDTCEDAKRNPEAAIPAMTLGGTFRVRVPLGSHHGTPPPLAEIEIAARGIPARGGGQLADRVVHCNSDNSRTTSRGARVIALLDAGHVVAVFASVDALRSYLMGAS